MLVYYYSRINGKVKIQTASWQKQLTDEQIQEDLKNWESERGTK